jgi:hypothetical protein
MAALYVTSLPLRDEHRFAVSSARAIDQRPRKAEMQAL